MVSKLIWYLVEITGTGCEARWWSVITTVYYVQRLNDFVKRFTDNIHTQEQSFVCYHLTFVNAVLTNAKPDYQELSVKNFLSNSTRCTKFVDKLISCIHFADKLSLEQRNCWQTQPWTKDLLTNSLQDA